MTHRISASLHTRLIQRLDCGTALICRAPRAPPNRIPLGRRRQGPPCCRIACLSSDYRLASDKAATRRCRQAQILESSITAKRRNSEKERERRAAELPTSRQAIGLLLSRLQLGDAFRRWSPAALPSGSEHRIHCARLTSSCRSSSCRAWNGEEHVPCRCLWSLERVRRRCRPACQMRKIRYVLCSTIRSLRL